MERSTWTDERLSDRFDQIDRRFDQVDREISALRTEMRDGFTEVRSEINDLRLIMIRFQGAMLVTLLGVIAAILARGA
jgi:hypothetical protein